MSRALSFTFLLAFGAVSLGAQARYDRLLTGGYVIDPASGLAGYRDVAVSDGKIAAVEERIDPAQADQVLDVTGLVVTPGLVDLHAHVFSTTGMAGAWAGDNSIRPDSHGFRNGVTTMVDAGSSGWRNFETLRNTVIDRTTTRVLAMINIAGFGMVNDQIEQSDFNADEVARLAKKHADVVVGVKSAHYQHPDWSSVEEAVKAGEAAGIPVMVDFGFFLPERPFHQLVLEKLRPGDMPTHCFRGPVPWVDSEGRLYRYLYDARERGIKFDVGHGGGSFVFRNAVPAIEQGFYPDSISTDLHTGSMKAGMMDMPLLMSKFLAMGMPLEEVIRASTSNPADQIQRPELGRLQVGGEADIAAFRIERGDFRFRDASGGSVNGGERLRCELTLRAGQLVWDLNSRSGIDYRDLPDDYGVRPEVDTVVTPPQ